MCRIFATQSPERWTYETRSVRLGGHSTSIRLEAAFWEILEEIAAAQEMSLPRFLTLLHDEVLEFQNEVRNFASLLRCACLTYATEVRGQAVAETSLLEEARQASGTDMVAAE